MRPDIRNNRHNRYSDYTSTATNGARSSDEAGNHSREIQPTGKNCHRGCSFGHERAKEAVSIAIATNMRSRAAISMASNSR